VFDRVCADPSISFNDKGIFPMKTHGWTTHIDMSPRAIPGKHAKGAHRAAPRNTGHRIIGMTLLLGSLAAGSAVMSGYAPGHAFSHDLVGAEAVVNTPWMY
jgi:hypothetical protein